MKKNFFESENKNITVFVDDYIIITEDSEPLFASIKEDNKLVVGICLLIEKAYAKINGSYLNIEGPFQPINTHFYFTGIPSIQYDLKEFENNAICKINRISSPLAYWEKHKNNSSC